MAIFAKHYLHTVLYPFIIAVVNDVVTIITVITIITIIVMRLYL